MLIRFREEQFAPMADIEAMFHQVRVALKDVNAFRFLWSRQNDLRQEPEEFQTLVHLFGGRWPPSVLNFALRKTADDKWLAELPKLERFNVFILQNLEISLRVNFITSQMHLNLGMVQCPISGQ